MDLNKNYYDILGVSRDSNTNDIKKQYRKLAKEHHPDVNDSNDDTKFKSINEAYEILSDDNKRNNYDIQSPHGKNYDPNSGFNGFFNVNFGGGGFNPFSTFFGGNDPFNDSFFSNIFRRKEEFPENLDIHIPVNITLKDVYNNNKMYIKFTHDMKCDICNFTGFDPDSDEFECDACDGKGGDRFTKCRFCNGTGKIHTGTCSKCNGTKTNPVNEEFAFENIFNMDKDFVKYMKGLGNQSKHYSAKAGTLIIDAKYLHDNKYIRDGINLIYQLDLHYQYAIDGHNIEYEHLDDRKYSLKIPPKTKDGDLLRMPGKGLLNHQMNRGDLLFKVNIIIDYDLS